MLHSDGSEIWFEHALSPGGGDDHKVSILISRDISDRRERQRLEIANAMLRAEMAANAANRRHAMALEAIADVVFEARTRAAPPGTRRWWAGRVSGF